MKELEAVIGLEVHAQMNTKTKMFCSCSNDAFGKPPNTLVCPVCMGHPGTLPVPNDAAVKKATVMSLALGCTISMRNHFSRKNYFYPDLPAGYQISQYDFPLAEHGSVSFGADGEDVTCGITRLHMENDAGKLMHRGERSLCDYNRAGTPLMEIVTEPDLRSAKQAVAFAQELRRILLAVNASEADMFKGMMRFDASISLRPKGEKKLYPRTEIKNLNSFKSLEKALLHEEKKLRKAWESGSAPTGETTVGWIDDEEKTVLLRDKESAADYRYFPEPDIPPLTFDEKMIDELKKSLPELPAAIRAEYAKQGLSEADAQMLLEDADLRRLFDAVTKETKDAKRASSLILTQLRGFLNAHEKSVAQGPQEAALVALAKAIDDGTISANAGKEVLEEMVVTGKDPQTVIDEKGLTQMTDTGEIEKIVESAIAQNAEAIASYKAGKQSALGPVIGWIMKESKGKANPKTVNEILRKKI